MKGDSPICIQCGNRIHVGRPDKKFCNPECKDKYNNNIKVREQQEIKKVDTILRRNRRILKKFYNPEKPEQRVSREQLLKAGFEFGFHTHFVVTRMKRHEITFCYDFGYLKVSDQAYQIYPSFSRVQVKDGDLKEIL